MILVIPNGVINCIYFSMTGVEMWKSCEIEICPWHDPHWRGKQSSASRSDNNKNKIRRKKSKSTSMNDSRNCDQIEQEEIDACKSAKIIPSCESKTNEKEARTDKERTKDNSERINEPASTEVEAHSLEKQNKNIKKKSRPKTAPPCVQQQAMVEENKSNFLI